MRRASSCRTFSVQFVPIRPLLQIEYHKVSYARLLCADGRASGDAVDVVKILDDPRTGLWRLLADALTLQADLGPGDDADADGRVHL